MNRCEEVLMHHGIKGMKWGIKNGPPYPLNSAGQYKNVKQLNDEMNKKMGLWSSI